MRRKKKVDRPISPDIKYGNVLVSKFINHLMRGGKKSVAAEVLYDAFELVSTKTKKDPVEVFDLALTHVGPIQEVKSRRIGGATYQVPMEVRGERKTHLAIRWILDAERAKKGKPMREKLAEEFIAASNNEGDAVKKRDNTHRLAEAHRAFAHFAR